MGHCSGGLYIRSSHTDYVPAQRRDKAAATPSDSPCCCNSFFGPRRLPELDIRLQILHHFLELWNIKRLRAVADRFFWRGVYLHDQAVGADGNTPSRNGGHEAALPRRVARIENHGKMRQLI